MASLRDKLKRLPMPPKAKAAAPFTVDMERLRGQLSALVGAGATASQRGGRPARQSVGLLPFEATDSLHGKLRSRRVSHPPTARVGAAKLDAARCASREVLSLLGLTPEVARCDLRSALYLDTETTGLGGGTGNIPFLVGMSWAHEGGFVLEQCFVREPSEEPAMLERVRARIEAAELLVSFNGKSFDLPLLRARFVMNRLPPLPERPHLDLMHLARRVHKRRSWRKTLTMLEEQVLGFRRQDDVSGEEVAQRYLQFLRTGDEAGLLPTIDHNAMDVLSLVALLGVYGEPPAHMPALELACAAQVMKRAGDLQRAQQLAELSVERGAGPDGLRARAAIAKSRGDKQGALADFEALTQQVQDSFARLELAKLYEHYVREPALALRVVDEGTSENEAASAHRRARLLRKLHRDRQRVASEHQPSSCPATCRTALASNSRLG